MYYQDKKTRKWQSFVWWVCPGLIRGNFEKWNCPYAWTLQVVGMYRVAVKLVHYIIATGENSPIIHVFNLFLIAHL